MDTKGVINLIRCTAQGLGLDPDLAVAIAGHETEFVPAKVRYEKAWEYVLNPKVYASRLGITCLTETVFQSTSWGAMQVMGSVCRELGYMDHLSLLVDPDLGISYGCRKLKKLCEVYSNEVSVIAAYNAGTPRKIGGQFTNQAYVDDVLSRLTKLRMIGPS